MKPFVFFLLLSLAGSALATTVDELPFVRALKDGHAVGALPEGLTFSSAAAAMQARTGSNAPVTVMAFRVAQFTQQPTCGRIAFGLYQESTHKFLRDGGGQINICQNGFPPNRICPASPKKTVRFDASCPDGQRSVDTPEVAAAIKAAIAAGGISSDEVYRQLHDGKSLKP